MLAKVSEDRKRVLRGYITNNFEGVKKKWGIQLFTVTL